MSEPVPDLSVEGTVSIEHLDPDMPKGWHDLLGSAVFEVTHKTKSISVTSTDRGAGGNVVANASIADVTEGKLKLGRMSGMALGMSLMGGVSDYAQSAGALPETEIKAVIGAWVDVFENNDVIYITGVAVKSKATAPAQPVTYQLGVDYEINPRFASIKALPGGAITDGQSLMITGNKEAIEGSLIEPGTKTEFRVRLRVDGLNRFDREEDVLIKCPVVLLTADSGIDFKSEKQIEPSFSVRFSPPPGQRQYTVRRVKRVA